MQRAAVLKIIDEATKGGTVDIHDTSLPDFSEAVLNRTLGYVSRANYAREKGVSLPPRFMTCHRGGITV